MATKKPLPQVDTSWMKEKLDIWITLPDGEKSGQCYKRGTILKVAEQDVTIRNEGGSEETVHASKISAANSYKDLPNGFDDMVDMENLSEAELLYNLQERYKKGRIFTYVGPTLIVLNPYCLIPELFTPEVLLRFQTSVRELKFDSREHEPHVYALGAASMTNLVRDQRNQAIVISGESGAGKTENTKFAMKFLTSLNDVGQKKNPSEVSIEDKILACNPVLEAFGNSKTVRNDNSSRFGKYVSLLISKGSSQRIMGATITNYLLEKSRICIQASGERNYHIFYLLFKGASTKMLEDLFLIKDGKPLLEKFEYLNKSGCYSVPTVNDKEFYDEVAESFRTMEFRADEQQGIWSLVSATLFMGQLEYDESTLTDKVPCGIKNEEPLQIVCKLLQMDFAELSKAIRFKFREIQGQVIESPQSKLDCVVTRDALAKELYNRLFNWLVKRLNFTVMPSEMLVDGADIPMLLNNYFHIGLLDIFGFEIFKFNSLEQLCINYTNEKLQQLYIAYVFKNEAKVFIQEGLQDSLCELNFEDNQPVIDLLELPPMGIFQMIDESCQVNTTDEALCQKIIKQHGTNPKLTEPKMAKMSFIINHTASSVEYNTDGFRFKNRDELSPYIEKAIFNSKFETIIKIYKGVCGSQKEPEASSEKKGGKSDKFIGPKFRAQMKELMTELQSCDCHFVRCIKPNDKKEKKLFMPYMTLQQIIYMGVLDTIKVRKDSYPVRRLYKTFFERYGELSSKHSKKRFEDHVKDNADFKAMTIDLLQEAAPELKNDILLLGNTRIFMRIPAEVELNKKFEQKMVVKQKAARRIQRMWFKYIWLEKLKKTKIKMHGVLSQLRRSQNLFRVRKEYQRFQRIRSAVRKIGRWWRRLRAKWHWRKLRKAVIKIQAWWRSIFYRRKYLRKKKAMVFINRMMRGALVRVRVQRKRKCARIVEDIIDNGVKILMLKLQNKMAIKIQKVWRGYITRKKNQAIIKRAREVRDNLVFNKKAKIIQRTFRGVMVRRALKKLNAAAGFIQGFYKMKWYSSIYKTLRNATRIIQRNVLKWMYTKRIKEQRNVPYLECEKSLFRNQKKSEQSFLFSEGDPETGEGPLNQIKRLSVYSINRINMFIKVVDVDILADLSDVYESSWSLPFLELQNEICANSDAQLQLLEVGETHTLAVSNSPGVYAWGWNDHFQLGRDPKPGEIVCPVEGIEFGVEQFRPKQIAAGDEHNLLLDSSNNLFVWGGNKKGQLGLGHNDPVNSVSKLNFTGSGKITHIKAKGHNSLAITESGAAYYWPLCKLSGDVILRPVLMNIPSKIHIQTGSCGYNFAVLLASNGLLYSFGIDNSAGQLGLGHYQAEDEPRLIESLKYDGGRITQVSCGYKHAICKNTVGKVFAWGWGMYGQLGNGSVKDSPIPRQVDTSSFGNTRAKITQVQAGYRHSMIMTEGKKVYWMGTNGAIAKSSKPVEVDFSEKIPDFTNAVDFMPIKVHTTWSKSISLTYISFCDTRTLELNSAAKDKVVTSMVQKIEEHSAQSDMDLPYVDYLAKHFMIKIVEKQNLKPTRVEPKLNKSVLIESPMKSKASQPGAVSQPNKALNTMLKAREIGEVAKSKEIKVAHRRVGSAQMYEPLKTPEKKYVPEILPSQTSPLKFLTNGLSTPLTNGRSTPLTDKHAKPLNVPNLPTEKIVTEKIESSTSTGQDNSAKQPEWEFKLREIKKKFETILMIPKEKWSNTEFEFMKIASDPKVFEMIKKIK